MIGGKTDGEVFEFFYIVTVVRSSTDSGDKNWLLVDVQFILKVFRCYHSLSPTDLLKSSSFLKVTK